MTSYLEIDDDLRPDDDVLLGQWMEDRERGDDQTLAWQLGAIAAIHGAFAKSFTSKQVEIEVGPPTPAKDIAVYEKSLPGKLPADLREAWAIAGSVR